MSQKAIAKIFEIMSVMILLSVAVPEINAILSDKMTFKNVSSFLSSFILRWLVHILISPPG